MDTPAAAESSWQAPRPLTGPAPGLRYAGFWIRVAAYLVDLVALAGIMTLVWWTTSTSFVELRTTHFQNGSFSGVTFSANLTLWAWLLVVVYFVGLWAIRGQTLGMLAFELRILRASDGRRIGPGRALIRFIGMIISFVVFLIGVIWVAADGRKQGWHDKIARTVVVWPEAESAPPVVDAPVPPAASPAP